MQKLLLEAYGLLLSGFQGRSPSYGVIWHGEGCNAVKLLGSLPDFSSETGNKVHLVEHCQICEFRKRCHEQAVKEDSLSLLRGMSLNEVPRLNQKGIFTITQLSYTFRIRQQSRRVKRPSNPHLYALQAMAIREKKVFVHGSPALPSSEPRVFVDIEGDPELRIGTAYCGGWSNGQS